MARERLRGTALEALVEGTDAAGARQLLFRHCRAINNLHHNRAAKVVSHAIPNAHVTLSKDGTRCAAAFVQNHRSHLRILSMRTGQQLSTLSFRGKGRESGSRTVDAVAFSAGNARVAILTSTRRGWFLHLFQLDQAGPPAPIVCHALPGHLFSLPHLSPCGSRVFFLNKPQRSDVQSTFGMLRLEPVSTLEADVIIAPPELNTMWTRSLSSPLPQGWLWSADGNNLMFVEEAIENAVVVGYHLAMFSTHTLTLDRTTTLPMPPNFIPPMGKISLHASQICPKGRYLVCSWQIRNAEYLCVYDLSDPEAAVELMRGYLGRCACKAAFLNNGSHLCVVTLEPDNKPRELRIFELSDFLQVYRKHLVTGPWPDLEQHDSLMFFQIPMPIIDKHAEVACLLRLHGSNSLQLVFSPPTARTAFVTDPGSDSVLDWHEDAARDSVLPGSTWTWAGQLWSATDYSLVYALRDKVQFLSFA
ncbi:hypothetical protein WJX73_003102 [Symbiochloris irregularis]|uniref:Uncharacterized protein n=1 Tax=Symbiochloris irregularis TaxID=706552 RepID=A0AAW1P003_9CHLO